MIFCYELNETHMLLKMAVACLLQKKVHEAFKTFFYRATQTNSGTLRLCSLHDGNLLPPSLCDFEQNIFLISCGDVKSKFRIQRYAEISKHVTFMRCYIL